MSRWSMAFKKQKILKNPLPAARWHESDAWLRLSRIVAFLFFILGLGLLLIISILAANNKLAFEFSHILPLVAMFATGIGNAIVAFSSVKRLRGTNTVVFFIITTGFGFSFIHYIFHVANCFWGGFEPWNSTELETAFNLLFIFTIFGSVWLWRNAMKNSYQKLARNQHHFRQILSATSSGYNITDQDYNLLYVNPSLLERHRLPAIATLRDF